LERHWNQILTISVWASLEKVSVHNGTNFYVPTLHFAGPEVREKYLSGDTLPSNASVGSGSLPDKLLPTTKSFSDGIPEHC
jgi:hypothetical protein